MKTTIKYLAILFMSTFISCTDETVPLENTDTEGVTEKIFYTLNGEKYPLDVLNDNGSLTVVENEKLTQYDTMFDNENLVTYIDSENHDPLYFSDHKNYTNYISDNLKVAERLEKIGVSNNKSVTTKSSSVPSFEIARHSNFRTKTRIPVSSTYSNRHVGFNKCITGGMGFQDAISSISVQPGLKVSFYVKDNYHGRVLIIDNRYNSRTISIYNLQHIKRKRNSFFNDNGDLYNINNLCGSICHSWNDCITSIYAERRGYSGSKNYKNVCSTGTSGGSTGGGSTGPGPKDDGPNMK